MSSKLSQSLTNQREQTEKVSKNSLNVNHVQVSGCYSPVQYKLLQIYHLQEFAMNGEGGSGNEGLDLLS